MSEDRGGDHWKLLLGGGKGWEGEWWRSGEEEMSMEKKGFSMVVKRTQVLLF